jgi:hypothetical protein
MKSLQAYGGWALITGASSGIGHHFARAIAAQGVNCILVARRLTRLNELATALQEEYGVQTISVDLDLMEPSAVETLLVATRHIVVSILVNNAGVGYAGPFATRDAQRMDDLITLNCRVPVALTRAYLPPMLEQRRGAVIIVSSVLGMLPGPYDSVYSASKAFDLFFGESLWAELRGTGVDVVTVCPGPTRTEFFISEGRTEDESAPLTKNADDPADVVGLALKALGKRPVAAPFYTSSKGALARFLPRRTVASIMRYAMKQVVGADKVP